MRILIKMILSFAIAKYYFICSLSSSISFGNWEEDYIIFSFVLLFPFIIFTLKSGVRSEAAVQFLQNNGFTDVKNYVGSADEWFRS
jgi:hypothetical protein